MIIPSNQYFFCCVVEIAAVQIQACRTQLFTVLVQVQSAAASMEPVNICDMYYPK